MQNFRGSENFQQPLQDFSNRGEKKNKKILQDHIVSIGNVVRQLGLELNAVEQRAQMTV